MKFVSLGPNITSQSLRVLNHGIAVISRRLKILSKGLTILSLGVIALSLGCASGNLPDYVKLGDLRVLALIANTPEVNTGATVAITPVLSDINGKGRALTYSAASCHDPGVSYGATPTCEGSNTKSVLATDVAVAGISAPNYTGASTSTISVTVPSTIFDQRTSLERYNGVSLLFTFQVKASDGTKVDAIKRILVSTKPSSQLNQNPQISALTRNAVTLSSLPSIESTIQPTFSAGTPESYGVLQSDGTTISNTETLTSTWFISDGTVELFRTLGTSSNKFTPPTSTPSGRNVMLVFVTHDGRGGEGYQVLSSQ